MTVSLWLLIPGIPLALIGAVVVAFCGSMVIDEIRLDHRRKQKSAPRPTLQALANPDYDPALDDDPFAGLVVDFRTSRRRH